MVQNPFTPTAWRSKTPWQNSFGYAAHFPDTAPAPYSKSTCNPFYSAATCASAAPLLPSCSRVKITSWSLLCKTLKSFPPFAATEHASFCKTKKPCAMATSSANTRWGKGTQRRRLGRQLTKRLETPCSQNAGTGIRKNAKNTA